MVNIQDQYMTLMSDNGDIREDLRVPDSDTGKDIESKFEAGEDFMVSVGSLSRLSEACRPPLEAGSDCRGQLLTLVFCVSSPGVSDLRHG